MMDENELRRVALQTSLDAQKVHGHALTAEALVVEAKVIHEFLTGSKDGE